MLCFLTYNQMVVDIFEMNHAAEDKADALFHALADRTRRDIFLRRVLAGEHSVTNLAGSYAMSFAAVQKHVAELERAGLLTKRRQGRESLASGKVNAVRSAASLLFDLESIWRGRIDRIDALLDQTSGAGRKNKRQNQA
jgi:DNA-binding transcriptional ArsR family regulator